MDYITGYIYRVKSYGTEIEKLPMNKETPKCVWVDTFRNGRFEKALKVSDWARYFGTWIEAKAYMLDRCDAKIRRAQSEMDAAKAEKQKVNNIQQPVD
jgi:hypothetical protein